MSKQSLAILVSGSLAYDYIMDFPGFFSDHILPEKIHQINLSFGLKKIEKKFGGTGGNIAYTLSLLKTKVYLVGNGGADFNIYRQWLIKHKVDLTGLKISQRNSTAAAYIITDQADNQIAGFYAGAMNESVGIPTKLTQKKCLAIISPQKSQQMFNHGQQLKRQGIAYIFDPGQAIIALTKTQIVSLLNTAKLLIVNDYEASLLFKKISKRLETYQQRLPIIVTYGAKGSKIFWQNKISNIKAVKAKKLIDPTGAGDAYRAGLLFGLAQGKPLLISASYGSTAASYAVEKYGTQEHNFTVKDFWRRWQNNFPQYVS